MNVDLKRKYASLVLVAMLLIATFTCNAARRSSPAVPDLDDRHDWNLGPTGARGWIYGWKLETTKSRQILVTKVDAASK